jgi:hypothetical protein
MSGYRFLADLMVVAHAAYVGFVVFGLAAILVGVVFRWAWVRNLWFRLVHLLAILVVAAEALLGIVCPLTTWEDGLREAAGETVQEGSFVGRWVHELLFVEAPPWGLTLAYCLFALAVVLAFVLAPPQRKRARPNRAASVGNRNDAE